MLSMPGCYNSTTFAADCALPLCHPPELCKPLDDCSARFPKGRFAYTRLANLIDIPQVRPLHGMCFFF